MDTGTLALAEAPALFWDPLTTHLTSQNGGQVERVTKTLARHQRRQQEAERAVLAGLASA